jgi:hypothetical protein
LKRREPRCEFVVEERNNHGKSNTPARNQAEKPAPIGRDTVGDFVFPAEYY